MEPRTFWRMVDLTGPDATGWGGSLCAVHMEAMMGVLERFRTSEMNLVSLPILRDIMDTEVS